MNEYGMESFIQWCDDVTIAEEGVMDASAKVGLKYIQHTLKTKHGMLGQKIGFKMNIDKRLNKAQSPDECDDVIAICDKTIRLSKGKINGSTEKEKSVYWRTKKDFADVIKIAEDYKRKAILKKSQLMKGQ